MADMDQHTSHPTHEGDTPKRSESSPPALRKDIDLLSFVSEEDKEERAEGASKIRVPVEGGGWD